MQWGAACLDEGQQRAIATQPDPHCRDAQTSRKVASKEWADSRVNKLEPVIFESQCTPVCVRLRYDMVWNVQSRDVDQKLMGARVGRSK
jgi:hypothetical protein